MSDVLTRLILLLAGLLAGASSSAILAEPVGGQEPVPIEAGLAPTGLPAPTFCITISSWPSPRVTNRFWGEPGSVWPWWSHYRKQSCST